MAKGRNRVTDRDLGWKRIKRELNQLGSVAVGFQADGEIHDEAGATVAEVAFWNEFGTSDGRVPERPFLRQAYDQNASTIMQAKRSLLSGIYSRRLSAESALRILGELHQGHIQAQITDLRSPPNAPSTIAKKGSSNPLIDSAQMRAAVRYEVQP